MRPKHEEIIHARDEGFLVKCSCGQMPEIWKFNRMRAEDAWIEHVEAKEPGIFDANRGAEGEMSMTLSERVRHIEKTTTGQESITVGVVFLRDLIADWKRLREENARLKDLIEEYAPHLKVSQGRESEAK